MKKQLQGYLAGAMSTLLIMGGVTYAKSKTETIEVTYDNIKVYKDNVLCELKDSNGSVIEPFIYNGTTYMPVRGTASLADMDVTWEGATKSVYLWDELVPSGTFLLDVCYPYEKSNCSIYLSSEGKSFEMAGEDYSNGLKFSYGGGWALFNLNSKYSTLECTIGHAGSSQREKKVSFIVDGKTVKEFTIEKEELPKTVSIPISYGLQMKIVGDKDVGVGNITVK